MVSIEILESPYDELFCVALLAQIGTYDLEPVGLSLINNFFQSNSPDRQFDNH